MGSFARSITLPTYVDLQHAEAKYENGTLTVTALRIAGKEPKSVQIKAA